MLRVVALCLSVCSEMFQDVLRRCSLTLTLSSGAFELNSPLSGPVRVLVKWNVCGTLHQGAHAAQSPELRPNDDLHVTLLFVGGVRDQELASRYPKFPDAETFAGFRRHLESNGGHMVELEVATIVMDERIAAAKVSGIDQWCANVYPHITLAYRRGVPPKLSNEVLARQAANLDFEVGLKPWLAELGLMRHEAAVLEWCRRQGISSVDEVAKHAANLAAMLEHDVDQRARTKLTLLGGATGNLHCVQQAPLKLTGVVRGRRRGE